MVSRTLKSIPKSDDWAAHKGRSSELLGFFSVIVGLIINVTSVYGQGDSQPIERKSTNSNSSGVTPSKPNSVLPGVANQTDSDKKDSGKRLSLDELPASIRYLPNQAGEWVPVPFNATYEAFMKFMASREDARPAAAPMAAITALEITGNADDDRATLNARLVIHSRKADEFVRVPLQFNEATLTGWKYTGDGQWMTDRKDRDLGLQWWFRGTGPHTLDLSLTVPVKKQLPSRRLQLSLPSSPVTKMTLFVPHRTATASLPDAIPLETSLVDGGRTKFEVFGLGNRLDLSWQPIPELTPTAVSLEANTTILAQIDADGVLLDVQQRVQALQGRFESLHVQLPDRAEILKIEGDDYRDRMIDPAKPNWVTIALAKPVTGPVRLRWTIRMPPPDRRRWRLEGFSVEGARKQSGEIGLAPSDGLRLSTLSQQDGANVLRIDAGELRARSGTTPVTSAHRFLGQPFHLTVGVEPIEPYYLVEPKLFVSASAQQLNLDAALPYQVYRDSLSDVSIQWPNWKNEGWVIDRLDPPDLIEATSIEEDKDSIRFRLVKRQTAAFQLRLRARRPIKGGEDVPFTLPRARSSSTPSTTLVLANAENVESELTAQGATLIRPTTSALVESTPFPDSFKGLKWLGYQIESDDQSFSLKVTPQVRRLRIEGDTDAAWQNDRVQITQRIGCDVAYERLTSLRLKVPVELPPERLRFYVDKDVELKADWVEDGTSAVRFVRLALPEPRIGRFELQARYFVPVDEDLAIEGDGTVEIPLLTGDELPFVQSRFTLSRVDWFEATAANDFWKAQPLRPESWQWRSDNSPGRFSLKIVRSRSRANGTASVSRGLVTVDIDRSGTGQVRAQFRIAARSSTLNIALPPKSEPQQVFWDRRPLVIGVDAVELPAGSRKFTLRLPENERESVDHLLTFDYQVPCATKLNHFDAFEVLAPQMPQCSWVAQVVWQIVLPPGQYAFTYPTSATPMFRWRRHGLLWFRHSEPDPSQLGQWIGASVGPKPLDAQDIESPATSGNLYAFSQFGAPRTLSFRSLSGSMIILLGSGLSLLAGFTLLRIPMLRHVLTVLLLGLILAAIGLWQSAPLELLLQPMILGLAFSVVALAIEGWLYRRYSDTIVTVPTSEEISAANASHFDILSEDDDFADYNMTTQHRPIPTESHDSQQAEAGSGVS